MYALTKTQLEASCVDLCASARLIRSNEINLVTAGANVLRIFRIRPQDQDEQVEAATTPKMGMECVGTWSLHASIQSLSVVGSLMEGRDALLLSFLDAKLSVVVFDVGSHDLKTISLHIFEEEEMREGFDHNFNTPEIRVDPDNRCAAMLVYGKRIVVLPFHHISDPNGVDSIASSYTLDLDQVSLSAGIETRINNIVDFQFLHGYNQPTMLILYEPLKTFPGRIAVRKDTCRVDVITLDVKDRLSAFIWCKDNLPFDCTQAMAVPRPLGGILVLAPNSVFYLSQGAPPLGVAINSLGDATLDNVEKKVPDTGLALDGSHSCFLDSDRVVFTLKGGELYVMTFLLDAMRSVRGFHFDRAAASVLSTSICKLEDGFLFLGSRLGNPILLRYIEKEIDASTSNSDQPEAKRLRMSPQTNSFSIDDNSLDVDLQVYGDQAFSLNSNDQGMKSDGVMDSQIRSLKFEVCESLLNIGPCSNISMGEPAFLSDEFATHKQADPDVELVTSSGHGKNGAICLLHQSIRPQVVTTFELPSCQDMFTVRTTSSNDSDEGYHAFLLLARADSTLVLETGDEINELEKSGFFTEGTTVMASNLGSHIVQVALDRIRLISYKAELIQELMLSESIIQASTTDPYLLVLTDDHQVSVVTVENSKLTILKVNLKRGKGDVIAINAYEDKSGLFIDKIDAEDGNNSDLPGSPDPNGALEEDEDALLYGSTSLSSLNNTTNKDGDNVQNSKKHWWFKDVKRKEPTFWSVLLKENGQLEFWAMPDFTLKYVINEFEHGKDVLVDADYLSPNVVPPTPKPSSLSSKRGSIPSKITEIALVGLGLNGRRPLLMARNALHDLFVYEAFEYEDKSRSKVDSRLKLRFKRLKTKLILRNRSSRKVGKLDDFETNENRNVFRSSLRLFEDVNGYEGVFVCGPYPHWLMLSGRGELRTHPMSIDDCISSFASFHNKNCQKGFIYFNHKSQLRICVLPTHVSYDAGWPVRRMPLKATVHFVTYHLESKTYGVVTAQTQTTRQVWKFNGDDKELCTEEREDPDRFPWPTHDSFSVQLYSPLYWKAIPNTQQSFEPYERCTGMKHLFLSCEGLHTGQRGYIACCTSFAYGEDVTPRGNIRIYDVIEVVPEVDQPITKNQIKLIYCKEQKGPVTAVAAVNGYLVAAVGQKVYIFQFKNKDLFGVAFIDSQIYIHQLVSLKNFLLVGDVLKSIDLMQFQEDYRTLAVISRDSDRNIEIYCCEYLVDNTQVSCIVSDADRNLVSFIYQPENPESQGGQKLIRCADFQLGQQITSMFRIKARITDPTLPGRVLTGYEKRHITWFGTLDGSLGYLMPCSEKTYRRLLMLQNVMNQSLSHVAGLNPKGCRMLRQRYRELINPSRSILDGDLICSFVDLPFSTQKEISRRIGIDSSDLIDNLAEIDRMAAHF